MNIELSNLSPKPKSPTHPTHADEEHNRGGLALPAGYMSELAHAAMSCRIRLASVKNRRGSHDASEQVQIEMQTWFPQEHAR